MHAVQRRNAPGVGDRRLHLEDRIRRLRPPASLGIRATATATAATITQPATKVTKLFMFIGNLPAE